MDDEHLLRYSRQIMLPQIGYEGQLALGRRRVLLIGVGGLGSPVAMYLAAAGVGELVLSDHDRVDLANLQRQVIFDSQDVGQLKVEAARAALARLNPDVTVTALPRRLDQDELTQRARKADVVIDASDNFATRFAVNLACVRAGTPLVSGAVIRLEGQVAVFDTRQPDAPCYRCLYEDIREEAERCAETGILGPVAGIIACVQATEAVKLLLGFGETLAGRLLLLDAALMQWRSIRVHRDPACPVCASRAHAHAAR
jgi:adenylyltransferase/sulfurtransferase